MDFEREVIQTSHKVPVVVDFWAPWCGPCQFLGPVMEELASEAGGKWKLVKVNTDENREISTNYSIQGIPAVKMFSKGEVITEFTGALPKYKIERWLEENLPDERKEILGRIRNQLLHTSNGEALDMLKGFVHKHPDFTEAKILLVRYIVFNEPEAAREMILDIGPANEFYQDAEDIKNIAEFLSIQDGEKKEIDHKRIQAKEAIENSDFSRAIERLIEMVMADKNYLNELPRKTIIALFNLLGKDHEITKKYRRRFDMALY